MRCSKDYVLAALQGARCYISQQSELSLGRISLIDYWVVSADLARLEGGTRQNIVPAGNDCYGDGMNNDELYVSVDVETSGPIPGEYSLLSVGACLVDEPKTSIYLELKPDSVAHDPEAVAVTGLDLDRLEREGIAPKEAMSTFEQWLKASCKPGHKIVFLGLNAPFDWSFINYYFHKYLGTNPFGFTAIDMKAYFMGATGCSWKETKSSQMVDRLKPRSAPTHNALDDARFQAELFTLMLEDRVKRRHD